MDTFRIEISYINGRRFRQTGAKSRFYDQKSKEEAVKKFWREREQDKKCDKLRSVFQER